MTCNDFLAFQKTPLFALRPEDSDHYLNPFGELLFSQTWKWNQLHQGYAKPKMSQTATVPSLKKEILLWFENLSDKDKISVTAISNSAFSEPFLRMLAHRSQNRLFNLSSQRWVDGIDVGSEDHFFGQLLDQLRVAYLSQPVLYFKSADVMDIRMLNWLNSVSNSRVFQYASKCKKGQQNPLWFSKHSYRYLQDWLASQLQIVIVQHFLNKSVSQFLPSLLQTHLKVIGKQAESLGLSLCLVDARKKTKSQLATLKTKLKEEEDRFMEYRQQKLINNIDVAELGKKKNKKKTKRKQTKNEEKDESKQQEKLQIKVLDQTHQQEVLVLKIKQQNTRETNIQTNTQKKQFCQRNKKIQISLQKHQKAQEAKEQKHNTPKKRNNSSSRNLIKVSPKRTRSPEYLRNREMLEQSQIKEKYSEEDKASFAFTEDQKSSEPTVSLGQSNIEERVGNKRRRKRGKKQNQKLNEVKQALYSRLTLRQMDNLVDELGIQTNSLYNHKIISFERVRVFVQSFYPAANAILFGSNAIGLSLPNSDVDILLTELRCLTREEASQVLAQIAVQINAMGWVVSCSTYLWAKVPIVKLEIDTSISFLQTKRRQDLFRVYNPALLYQLDHVGEVRGGTIKVDITINIEGITSVGYESTVLMRDWILRIPILQKLVLLFKYILSAQGYNSNFAGGIGSYCLFVMIAAYLKEKQGSQTELDLSRQFQNILKWYGQDFDNISKVVWLREQGACFISEYLLDFQIDETKRGLLKLIDPITAKSMNSSCNQYNNIKMEFRRILQEIKEWQLQIEDELRLGPVTAPQLLKVIQTKKSVDKWLNKFEQKHSPSLRAIIERTNN